MSPAPAVSSKWRGALVACLLAAVGLSGCGGDGDGGGGKAVVKDALYVSLNGVDGAACTAQKPCASITGALARAKAGQTILAESGRYPAQEVEGGPASAAQPVVVRPAPGAKPSFGKLSLHTKGLELRGLRMDGWYAYADAGHLTWDGGSAEVLDVVLAVSQLRGGDH